MNNGVYGEHGAEFHLQEFGALRAEVLALLETLRSLERNVVVAIGVSWAWLIDKGQNTPKWSWFVPVLFAVLGSWRVHGILRFFGEFREYFEQLEDSYKGDLDGPVGWQHFTANKAKVSDGTFAFWATLVLVTLAAAVWEAFFAPHHAISPTHRPFF